MPNWQKFWEEKTKHSALKGIFINSISPKAQGTSWKRRQEEFNDRGWGIVLSHTVFWTQNDYSTLKVTVIVIICAISAQEEVNSNANIDKDGRLQDPPLIENLLGMIASEDEKWFYFVRTLGGFPCSKECLTSKEKWTEQIRLWQLSKHKTTKEEKKRKT